MLTPIVSLGISLASRTTLPVLVRRWVSSHPGGQRTTDTALGFIGLGNMGGHMSANLVRAGFPIVVHDTNAEVVKRLVDMGATAAGSPRMVASQADVIITMLPSSPHVRSVYTGEEGVFQGAHAGSLLVDSSTIDPITARQIATQASEHGLAMVDAPVSGGVLGAENATLTFMIGGTDADFQRASDILRFMGKNLVHCGGWGNGQVAKICNNLLLAIQMTGTAEALLLGERLGMDSKRLSEIFAVSTSRCWSVDTYNPVPGVMDGVPSSRGYTGGFGSDLMKKDLGLAHEAAHAADVRLTLGDVVLDVYERMTKAGLGGKDFSAVYQLLASGDEPQRHL